MATQRKPAPRSVVADRLDLRDRPYQPAVARPPGPVLNSLTRCALPVLNQERTNACTGFALASVVRFLLHAAGRKQDAKAGVAPFMLYSMARRYDEFPGSTEDAGSSLRGAMKGWHKHGACRAELWKGLNMPAASPDPRRDWWQDAVRRPLGAYYRVDGRSITDMHVALDEVGVLYASAVCHSGWDEGFELPASRRKGWSIPLREAGPETGGHAFVIVGYDARGFLVLNSWGDGWGDRGVAVLDYADWLQNAMDCWVAQLGVVTEQHERVASASTLRVETGGRVTLSTDVTLRHREISPFIVDMENNGLLSHSGLMRTQEGDLSALVQVHMTEARKRWGLGANDVMDVAVYAHGGLTGELLACQTAANWIPALYDARIFPIFFMWETDAFSTIKNRLSDLLTGEPRRAGGVGDWAARWWNERLEGLFARPGTLLWNEMKQNASQIAHNAESGARKLYALNQTQPNFARDRVRLHLIGHSAGAIVHSHLAHELVKEGWDIASMHYMAPAVRTDVFEATVVPHLRSGKVQAYYQYHLTEKAERDDPTCKALLGYSHSLLYLVSRSFEGGRAVPILGMARHLDDLASRTRMQFFESPSADATSTTHGGFDDDERTRHTIIRLIKGAATGARTTAGTGTRTRARRLPDEPRGARKRKRA